MSNDPHYVLRYTIERVDHIKPEARSSYRTDSLPEPKETRVVTELASHTLKRGDLTSLIATAIKHLDLVEDDNIHDPKPKGNVR
jgi:hypothetical protein